MSTSFQYPEAVNQDDQFTPELMPLWLDAIKVLERKRNQKIIWQVPAFIVFWILTVLILGPLMIYVVMVLGVAFGMIAYMLTPTYDYIVSDDRRTAKFILSYKFRLFKLFFELINEFIKKSSKGMYDLFCAVLLLITFPIWGSFVFMINSLEFFNELWWLKGFKNWTERLEKSVVDNDNREHIRGTHIHPSIQLSGTAPDPLPKQPLEVLGGTLTLLPDGGIVIAGGAAFDQNSTFLNFSVNGLTLTRETQEMLKVSHEGSEHSFRFDGNSWEES